jgi:hypothetical protein
MDHSAGVARNGKVVRMGFGGPRAAPGGGSGSSGGGVTVGGHGAPGPGIMRIGMGAASVPPQGRMHQQAPGTPTFSVPAAMPVRLPAAAPPASMPAAPPVAPAAPPVAPPATAPTAPPVAPHAAEIRAIVDELRKKSEAIAELKTKLDAAQEAAKVAMDTAKAAKDASMRFFGRVGVERLLGFKSVPPGGALPEADAVVEAVRDQWLPLSYPLIVTPGGVWLKTYSINPLTFAVETFYVRSTGEDSTTPVFSAVTFSDRAAP